MLLIFWGKERGKYEEAEIQFKQAIKIKGSSSSYNLGKFRYIEKCIGERE